MLFWLVLFMVSGSTVYLLVCRRDFMINSNRRAPKFFLAFVGFFIVAMLAYSYGQLQALIV